MKNSIDNSILRCKENTDGNTVCTGTRRFRKTEYVIKKLIEESMAHGDLNYLYVVPEQFSMEAQRDIVTMHPRHGTMNIDAIGFNRLAYRVFDELSVNPGRVLEDFGKSMLIKKILMESQDELLVYGSYINKMVYR